jgi:ATP-dependent RNA helicase RhlE
MSQKSFAELGVSRPVVAALADRGIHSPFPVQRLVIEDVLAGRDVLAQSPTGSGKTLAFGVGIVDRIKAESRRPSALVLAPTRELACQIVDEMQEIAHSRALSVAPVYGGVGIQKQARIAQRAHILVATPGRLEDLIQRRELSLENVGLLVLDEADRMLDMGFKPAVDRIVKLCPRERQTLFFSATLEGAAGQLARSYTQNAARHTHTPEPDRGSKTVHRFVNVSRDNRMDALLVELRSPDRGRALVFTRTKHGADRLTKRLARENIAAVAMHGNKSQGQRDRALASFERGDIDTLVATDVAARGIDVADITHVINFDIPGDTDTYVHRTGRTGRAGATGNGVSLVMPEEYKDMRKIASDLGLHSEFDAAPGGRTHQVPADGNARPGAGRPPKRGPKTRGHGGRSYSAGGRSYGGGGGGKGKGRARKQSGR